MLVQATYRHAMHICVCACLWLNCTANSVGAEIAVNDQTRVSYFADDQNASVLLPALSTLAGENYEPIIDLLIDGVTATRATLVLHEASRSSCRQALAFALDCWWTTSVDAFQNKIVLTNKEQMPQGDLSVRTINSTLLRHLTAQSIAEKFLKPWIHGHAGVSFLPTDGLWSATLDEAGHRRLIEILSLLERPQPTASTLVPSVDIIDSRRQLTAPIQASSWQTLVNGLSQSGRISVALSPRLRLRVFPAQNILIDKMTFAELEKKLLTYDMSVFWQHGVLCLGEARYVAENADREHPAERRRLALVPIGHIISDPLDGELIVATIQKKISPRWWQHDCAGIRYITASQSLLIAADLPTQHAILRAISQLDRLGLELGLPTLGENSER